MKKIIVAGSINMDIVAFAERHPKPGETVIGKSLHFIPGGKGLNQAVAASRLGGQVSLMGKVGKDSFGDILSSFLKSEKLDLKGLTTSTEAPTGTALIVVNEVSENTIVVVPGSNEKFSIHDLNKIPLTREKIVVSQFEIPQQVIHELFRRARSVGATRILNPAPAVDCSKELLALVDYLIVNETELAFFAGNKTVSNINSIAAQARKLRASKGQIIIVTLGAKGVVTISGDELLEIHGNKANAIDTTGAGDCFVGALAVALSEGKSLRSALEFANSAATISVQRLGASTSLPYRNEIDMPKK